MRGPHYPVMLGEVLTALEPLSGETYLDGTFGNGGYTQAILEAADCNVIALDRDPDVKPRADEFIQQYSGRLRFYQTAFSSMDDLDAVEAVDAVILDIGVSSMQLDQAERGFSFMRSGPLDMRMAQIGPSAADVVRELSVSELTRIFQVYGEEKRARRAAQAIERARSQGDIVTTDALADILEQALGRTGKIHPATRVFQALRIFVNDELGELFEALCAAERLLRPEGRLIVVTFHSLEDRLVKRFLRRRSEKPPSGSRYQPEMPKDIPVSSFKLVERSAVLPSQTELAENSRSRSAKLRWAVRTDAPAFAAETDLLVRMPRVSDIRWDA